MTNLQLFKKTSPQVTNTQICFCSQVPSNALLSPIDQNLTESIYEKPDVHKPNLKTKIKTFYTTSLKIVTTWSKIFFFCLLYLLVVTELYSGPIE